MNMPCHLPRDAALLLKSNQQLQQPILSTLPKPVLHTKDRILKKKLKSNYNLDLKCEKEKLTLRWLAWGEYVYSWVNKWMTAVTLSWSPATANCFTIPSNCTNRRGNLNSRSNQKPSKNNTTKYLKGGIFALLVQLIREITQNRSRNHR